MSTTNYPSATPQSQAPKKDYRGLIIGLLAVGLLGTWGYLLWNNNKFEQRDQVQTTTIARVNDEKSEIQRSFDASLARLDSVTGNNNQLQSKLTEANNDIAKRKGEIRSILSKKNATAAELTRAKELIGQLNDKIAGLEQKVTELTAQNTQLNTDLTSEKGKTTQLTTDLQSTTTAKVEAEKKVESKLRRETLMNELNSIIEQNKDFLQKFLALSNTFWYKISYIFYVIIINASKT